MPGCELYGRCHCKPDCPKVPGVAAYTDRRRGYVQGRPAVFGHGHRLGREGNGWPRRGIPIERVRPLAHWLRDRYGYVRACEVVGLPAGTWDRVMTYTGAKYVDPETAKRIVDVVLAHRIPEGSRSPFDVERRVLPAAELERMRRREGRV